jgi:Kef-type K+ transport system membrane component KefB
MSMGIIVANVSPHSEKAFSSIETFSPPIISAFFILAGCRLDISYLPQIGVTGIAYFIFRIIGKISGASLGAKISNAPIAVKKYLGFGLLSQVGIAIGLAITVSKEFSGTELGSLVIAILLATTIVTELIAPVLTKNALIRAKETTN